MSVRWVRPRRLRQSEPHSTAVAIRIVESDRTHSHAILLFNETEIGFIRFRLDPDDEFLVQRIVINQGWERRGYAVRLTDIVRNHQAPTSAVVLQGRSAPTELAGP
jgi:hypothetical protein